MIFDIIFPVLQYKSQTIFAIAPALLALIPSLIQMGQGIAQSAKANKIAKSNQRPTYSSTAYKIPDEIKEYVARTKAMMNTRLPGQNLMENKIDANTSNAIAGIQQSGNSSADIINSISGINGQQNDAYNNLGIAGVQRYDQMQGNVNNALLTSAQYKDRAYDINSGNRQAEFEYNQNQPYQARAAAASALTGAGQQNIYNGIQGASNIGTMLAAQAQKTSTPQAQQPAAQGNPSQQPSTPSPERVNAISAPSGSFAQVAQPQLSVPSWMTTPYNNNTTAPLATPAQFQTNIYGNNSMVTPEMRVRLAQIQRLKDLGLITN